MLLRSDFCLFAAATARRRDADVCSRMLTYAHVCWRMLLRSDCTCAVLSATNRRNRPQAHFTEKEWLTAKSPRQLVSLKFEGDLRNYLCSRALMLNPAPLSVSY